jgi:hypothetical protein
MTNVQEYIRDNVKTHAAAAWSGYQSKGRGVVVAKIHYEDNDDNAAIICEPLEYLSENDPLVKQRGGWPVELTDEARRYDPEKEIVVFVIQPDGVTISRLGPLPLKQFYEDEMKK